MHEGADEGTEPEGGWLQPVPLIGWPMRHHMLMDHKVLHWKEDSSLNALGIPI